MLIAGSRKSDWRTLDAETALPPGLGVVDRRVKALLPPAVLLVGGGVAAAFDLATDAAYALWLIAVLAVGMPHGAYDLVALVEDARRGQTRSALRAASIYVAIMALCAAALVAAPSVALIAFLALSAHHFGVSDSVWTRDRLTFSREEHALAIARGGLVIAAPFAFSPTTAWAPFAAIADAVSPSGWPVFAPFAGIEVGAVQPIAVGIAAACVLIVAIGGLRRRRERERWRRIEEGATVLGIVVLSAFAPPLFAIGVYFVFVHALGHCLRATTPSQPAAEPSVGNLVRVHIEAGPLLAPSVAMVVAAALLFAPLDRLDAKAFTYAFLLFCAVATLPHHLLWLGRLNRKRHDQPAPAG